MKKICKLFSLAALAAFSLTSCMNDDNGGSVDPYANIRPGISIYNASVIQNSVATDPAAAAVRMAMLIDEAAVQDKSFDELTVIFRKTEISLKELLFGRGAMIEESEETPGEYRIRFVPSTPAVLDAYRREGTYLVRTGGVSLSEATAENPWSAEIESEVMYLYGSNQYASTNYRLTEGQTRLWRQADGIYRIEFEGMASCFALTPQFVSDWSGSLCWKPSTEGDDLSFKNHGEDSFTMYGEADGNTFYAFNNASTTRMSYQVSESTPLLYQPDKTLSATKPTGGTETARLTSPGDYPAADYHSSSVQVVYTVTNNAIYTTIHYNGVTQTL